MMVIGLNAHVKDSNNSWAVSFVVNTVDTRSSAENETAFFEQHFSHVFFVRDN
jgi:OOP family OmpA-OmpF porin